MAGISDKALKSQYRENKYRYNKGSELQNKEFSDGSGLEMYETHLRELDAQLGRWWQADPKTDQAYESVSPYNTMNDDPTRYNDPNGDEGEEASGCCKELWDGVKGTAVVLTGMLLYSPQQGAKTTAEVARRAIVSAGGAENGMINRTSGGLYSTDPYSTFTGVPTETNPNSIAMGQSVGLPMPAGPIGGAGPSLALAGAESVTIIPRALFIAPTLGITKVNAQSSIKEQAIDLKNNENGGRNSVTLNSQRQRIRFDLDGRAHGEVPTPHAQYYIKNFLNGVQKSISRASNKAVPLTAKDLRLLRNYFNSLKKK